jgi:hypothetical protein
LDPRKIDVGRGKILLGRRKSQFAKLTPKELAAVEALYVGVFEAKGAAGPASA